MITDTLLHKFPIISDQVDVRELHVLLGLLEKQLLLGTVGSIVEFGCYIGTTSLFIRRLCNAYNFPGSFHVYDSFVGLPDKADQDYSGAGEQFRRGELAVSKRDFIMQFKKAGLSLPIIHRAWFADLKPQDVPDDIMFAFLDGDYYQSIRDSLQLIAPKLTSHAIIVVDDYANEALPGAARATDEWLRGRRYQLRVESSLAIVRLV